jgi:hypothetical protein
MNMERTLLQGQLVEANRKYGTLKLEARNLIIAVRLHANPHQPDLAALNVEEGKAAMDRLDLIVKEIRDLKSQIKSLEEALG